LEAYAKGIKLLKYRLKTKKGAPFKEISKPKLLTNHELERPIQIWNNMRIQTFVGGIRKLSPRK
jgi:hypothetical protein